MMLFSTLVRNGNCWNWCKVSVIPLICILCAVVVALTGSRVESVFGLSSVDLVQGEYWRLLSANFAHTNLMHLLMNIAGFYVLYFFVSEQCSAVAFSVFTLLSGCLSLWFLSLWLQITWYVGLSSALHALLVFVAVSLWRRDLVLSLGIVGLSSVKMVAEVWEQGDTLSAALIDAPVFWQSHITGVLAGAVLTPLFYFFYPRKINLL